MCEAQTLEVDARVCTMTRTHVNVGACGGHRDCGEGLHNAKTFFFAEEAIRFAEVARIWEIEGCIVLILLATS